MRPRLSVAFVPVLVLFSLLVWLVGSTNPSTPAGYVGYLTKGAVFGKSRFYGVQRGPTSAGRSWLLQVTNVSVTPYTFKPCADMSSSNAGASLAISWHGPQSVAATSMIK